MGNYFSSYHFDNDQLSSANKEPQNIGTFSRVVASDSEFSQQWSDKKQKLVGTIGLSIGFNSTMNQVEMVFLSRNETSVHQFDVENLQVVDETELSEFDRIVLQNYLLKNLRNRCQRIMNMLDIMAKLKTKDFAISVGSKVTFVNDEPNKTEFKVGEVVSTWNAQKVKVQGQSFYVLAQSDTGVLLVVAQDPIWNCVTVHSSWIDSTVPVDQLQNDHQSQFALEEFEHWRNTAKK